MKIYIASKYIKHHSINTKIHDALKGKGYDVFLPASIDIDAITDEEMCKVAEICYKEIDNTDIFLAVIPFGLSVAAEVGYAISIKRQHNRKMRIIFFDTGRNKRTMEKIQKEAMIWPYHEKPVVSSIDLVVSSIEELVGKI